MPPFYFLVTFWGHEFADYLCKYPLASLLAGGNIGSLGEPDRARFLFCTTREDWEYLRAQPIFTALERQIKVELLINDLIVPGEHKYSRMSRGHAVLAQRCFEDRAVAINVNPDSIYPKESVAAAQALAAAGNRVALCTAIRFDMNGVDAELTASGALKAHQPLSISKRTAVEIGLRNLHPESMAGLWTAPNFGRLHPVHQRRHFLTCCIWTVPQENGVIIITHNWAPFMVNYGALARHDASSLDGRALDGNYIFDNFWAGKFDDIHVVQDSDELFLLGLTPREEMVPPNDAPSWVNRPILGQWSRGLILNQTVYDSQIDTMRRKAYQMPVYWHSSDLNPGWGVMRRQVDKLIDKYVSRDLREQPLSFLNLPERSWHERIWSSICP